MQGHYEMDDSGIGVVRICGFSSPRVENHVEKMMEHESWRVNLCRVL